MARVQKVEIIADVDVQAEMEGDEIHVTVNGAGLHFDAEMEVQAKLSEGEIKVKVNGQLYEFEVDIHELFCNVSGDQLVGYFQRVPGHLIYVIKTLPLEVVVRALLNRLGAQDQGSTPPPAFSSSSS